MNPYSHSILNIARCFSLQRLATLAAVAGLAALAACSGGAPTTANPNTQVASAPTYSGPPPANADVQAFMVNLWTNIKATNRCGGCHVQGGQSPQFARTDDVNLAYQAANTVVNLTQPDQSTMVQKVSGGHNCWLASPSACGDTLTVWIQNWAGSSATGSQAIKLVAPPDQSVGSSKTFPISPAAFQTTIYPVVTQYCQRCHAPTALTPQQPYFASADVNEAYSNAQAKIDLADANPTNANPPVPCTVSATATTCLSRFVARLATDHHNCWSDCTTDAQVMLTAIEQFADPIPLTTVDQSLVISKALTMYDGTVASGQNRYTTSQIALYEFKTGTGTIAYDTSGVEPELDLNLTGNYTWDAGWGVVFAPNSKAQGTTTASAKLYNAITSTGEFSIEAWVSPANVAQTGANIVSYSGGPTVRNATLSQKAFQYQANVRSSVTDTNGAPPLVTNPNNMLAQAALQHVVMTYDPVNGRKIYVDGVFSGDVDAAGGGTLANWDNTFALVLADETSDPQGKNQFQGELRMVAIHNRALTLAQIQQNYAAGVGQKYFLLFNVTTLTGVPQSYVMMTVSLNDNYSYLFTNPTFISLDPTQTPNAIPISGIRIGINGTEPTVGQSYIPLNTTITTAQYNSTTGQLLSSVGAVIALQNGPASDQFFLSFAQIGTQTHVYTDPTYAVPAPVPGPAAPDLGVRTFERLAQSMAKVTGVPMTDTNVSQVYSTVLSALPPVPDLTAFSAANQTAISQLAIAYCSEMVNTQATAFFGAGFDATQGGTYFSAPINTNSHRDQVINALYTNLVGGTISANLATQPSFASVQTELDSLITNLTPANYANTPNRSGVVTKAACAALLGSASTLVQ